jgi:hypothetical protein
MGMLTVVLWRGERSGQMDPVLEDRVSGLQLDAWETLLLRPGDGLGE